MTSLSRDLTPMQKAVVALIRDRYTYDQIAIKLRMSERTVRQHVTNIATKIEPTRPKGRTPRRVIAAWFQVSST